MATTWRSASLAGVAVVLAVAGCGEAGSGGASGGECTLIGCGSTVDVIVDQAGERPLEACVGAVCSPPGQASPSIGGLQLGDSVEVVVRVAGGGDVVARATAKPVETRPNGPDCGPVCRAVRLRLTVEDKLVPA